MKKFITATISSLLALMLCSCQSTAPVKHGPAVMCSKCQTVWVKTANSRGAGSNGFATYSSQKVMKCPDCESAVVTFFKTGQLKHECSHCGSTLEHCAQH